MTCREMSRYTKEPCGKPLPCADHSTPTNAPESAERCICGDCDIDGCRTDCTPCWREYEHAMRRHDGAPCEMCDRDNNLLAVMNLTTGEVAIVPPNPFSIASRFVKEGE